MASAPEYAHRLHEDIQKSLYAHSKALQKEVQSLRSHLASDLKRIEDKLEALQKFDDYIAGNLFRKAFEEIRKEHEAKISSLVLFAHNLRKKETQEEILAMLMDEVSRFAPRAVLFAIKGNQFCGRDSRGYSDGVSRKLASCCLEMSESPFLKSAMESEGLVTISNTSEEEKLLQMIPAFGPWHAFTLKTMRRQVAVLLTAASEKGGCELESLCILMDLTGLCIENLVLRLLEELRISEEAASAVEAGPEPAESIESPEETVLEAAEGVEPAAETVAEPAEDQGMAPIAPETAAPLPEPQLEALAAHEEIQPSIEIAPPPAAEEGPAVPKEVKPPEVLAPEVEAAPAAPIEFPSEEVVATAGEGVVEAARIVETPAEEGEKPAGAVITAESESEAMAAPVVESVVESPQPMAEEAPLISEAIPAPAAHEAPQATPAVTPEPPDALVESQQQVSLPPPAPSEIEAMTDHMRALFDTPATQQVIGQEAVPPAPLLQPVAPPPPIPVETVLSPEEEKLHADAKRFARLLVSEIKLYNEQRVVDGRRNHDLYNRLKKDIERSREMYLRRVAPVVAKKADYFHNELVRILGNNDPAALGTGYPGPQVES